MSINFKVESYKNNNLEISYNEKSQVINILPFIINPEMTGEDIISYISKIISSSESVKEKLDNFNYSIITDLVGNSYEVTSNSSIIPNIKKVVEEVLIEKGLL